MNECVILRNFGGFDTSYKHAILDEKRKTIVPPSKKITFRSEWVKDNGVLEKHIAESLKIKPEKASEYIEAYVKDLQIKLEKEGAIVLEGIGKFQLGESKKIQFTSLEDENYLADSFGLDILEVDIEQFQKDISEPVEFFRPAIVKRKFTGWYITICILILFIVITTFLLFTSNNGNSFFGFLNRNAKKPADSELVIFGKQDKFSEDSVTKSIEQNLDKKTALKNALSIQEQGKSIKPEPNLEGQGKAEISESGVTYYLVAGSFKSAGNAEVLKDKLLKKGLTPTVMNMNGKFTMVVVGVFKSKDEANEKLIVIRRQLGKSVWLMEK